MNLIKKWDNDLSEYQVKAKDEINQLDLNLKKMNDFIYQKEANKIESLKLKPSNKIKLLENQEKLVAINERIEEADNFKKELKKKLNIRICLGLRNKRKSK